MAKNERGKNRIDTDPEIMSGKPVIHGTRVPVETILRKLSEGATEDEVLEAYPQLEPEDLKAALEYGADAVSLKESISS